MATPVPAETDEPILDPDRPIIDPHFHFFTGRGHEFAAADFLAHTASGHRIVGAVHVEANADFFADGGAPGEMRFAAAQGAAMRDMQAGQAAACDPVMGIVGYADLRAPDLDDRLDALIEASGGRLRGIRNSAAWDPSPDVRNGHTDPPRHLLRDPDFRAGLTRLAARGLTFDSYVYYHQLDEVAELADAVPFATIVCEHTGGIIGVGRHAGQQSAYFDAWAAGLARLAKRPNVTLKLGGLAMSAAGFGWHKRGRPLGSEEYAGFYAPWVDCAIGAFGPDRCMFESNFPVDGVAISYSALWNGFKRLAADHTSAEKDDLFHATALRAYRLE
jgi:predicted TIM-barrel fold metal-dependent hydrolase